MQIDPVQEWQRLAAEYREKSPEELLDLARDFTDLTETAQQALRSETHSRGMGAPEALTEFESSSIASRNSSVLQTFDSITEQTKGVHGAGSSARPLVPENSDAENDDGALHDYTWKTPLCECFTREEAAQLQEALRRAGIESWFNFGGYTTSFVPQTSHSVMFGDIQILVAADQLDQARTIAAQPIPQQIIDESKEEIPEFVEPKCPKCGSDDVVLEGVNPENTWRCEQCDAEWIESISKTDNGTPESANQGS